MQRHIPIVTFFLGQPAVVLCHGVGMEQGSMIGLQVIGHGH